MAEYIDKLQEIVSLLKPIQISPGMSVKHRSNRFFVSVFEPILSREAHFANQKIDAASEKHIISNSQKYIGIGNHERYQGKDINPIQQQVKVFQANPS